jgi:hypothetical protein
MDSIPWLERISRIPGSSPIAPRVQGPGTRMRPGDATKLEGGNGYGRLRTAAYGGGRRGTVGDLTVADIFDSKKSDKSVTVGP